MSIIHQQMTATRKQDNYSIDSSRQHLSQVHRACNQVTTNVMSFSKRGHMEYLIWPYIPRRPCIIVDPQEAPYSTIAGIASVELLGLQSITAWLPKERPVIWRSSNYKLILPVQSDEYLRPSSAFRCSVYEARPCSRWGFLWFADREF